MGCYEKARMVPEGCHAGQSLRVLVFFCFLEGQGAVGALTVYLV